MLKTIMDDTRPMDNMRLAHDSPQEDEVATNQLSSCLASPYAPLMFRNWKKSFDRLLAWTEKTKSIRANWKTLRIW